jgi:hypothetical protein
MTILLTPEELGMFANAPEDELVDLSVDLDVMVPEEIDRPTLLSECIRNLRNLAELEGLPMSDYDREDLAALSQEELDGIARLCGVQTGSKAETIERMLKAGKKVYKRYSKHRPRSQVPMYLPMLLAPLARYVVMGPESS